MAKGGVALSYIIIHDSVYACSVGSFDKTRSENLAAALVKCVLSELYLLQPTVVSEKDVLSAQLDAPRPLTIVLLV